ncbi:MAG: DUF2079 domain-containing protein, partial [Dehalococcoidia bacterium]|nr:DUF2079 domain-containing protein [Dehalococcoidia bacterium]
LVFAYLMSPTLQFTTLYDFHEVVLATVAFAFATEALVREWWRRMAAWLILAMLSKEEIGLVVAGFGATLAVWGALDLLRRRTGGPLIVGGACLAVVGVGWTVVAVTWLIPWFEGSGAYTYLGRYDGLGDTPFAVVATVFADPFGTLARLATADRLTFVLSFVAPTALLAILAPDVLLLAAPTFGYLLTSSYPAQYSLGRQYGVFLTPMLTIAAAVAWRRIAGWFSGRAPALMPALATMTVTASALTAAAYGPGPMMAAFDPDRYVVTERSLQARRIMALIPHDASVSAQENLAPHLSHRERLYLFPALHDADFVILDNDGGTYPLTRAQWDEAAQNLLANPLYRLVAQEGGIALFARQRSAPVPGLPTNVRYGDAVELIAVEPTRGAQGAEIALYWRVTGERPTRPSPDGYLQVARLYDPNGRLIVEGRRPPSPGGGFFEIGRGLPGEIVRERIPLSAPVAEGQLEVMVLPAGDPTPLPRVGQLPTIRFP